MQKQYGNNDHDSQRSNANQDFSESSHALPPPTFQLKSENQKEEESSTEEKSQSMYQLAASGELPPDSNPAEENNPSNNRGLPFQLKNSMEALSGYSMDDVNVHYNSSKPAELNAHAYAQGTDIHLASGQEKHLPHEAWHVVQQKQGRVKPTKQLKSKNINDDSSLETEADVMGAKAMQMVSYEAESSISSLGHTSNTAQLSEVEEENLEEAHDVADRMIEDSGGTEAIDAIFGGGFADRYYDVIVALESGELDFGNFIGYLPEDDQYLLADEEYVAYAGYELLFDIVYDETAKDPENVDKDQVAFGQLLLEEMEIRVMLLEAMKDYYTLLLSQGLLSAIPKLIKFCAAAAELGVILKIKKLEKHLIELQYLVEKAEDDVLKAKLEFGIDLAIGVVAVGLTCAGMMTPGVNAIIFVGGIAVGFALSTEDSTTKKVQLGTKGAGFAAGKALENNKRFGSHVGKIKAIGPILDVILNGKEAYDKYKDLAKFQSKLDEFTKYYDSECANLKEELIKLLTTFKIMSDTIENSLEKNWDILAALEVEIAEYKEELNNLS